MEKIVSALRQAMDYDQRGEWDKAHTIVQTIKHELACRIHGYLHRKEGDMDNALFWYRRIGVEPFCGDFSSEKADILRSNIGPKNCTRN